ncbi:TPA: hypothetical protein QFD45_000770 [Enterococcus faecium]|uniref:hypothetical protein n=1 Tax=Enterococcus TaxID=1350 RepID=UPI0002A34A8A|nr:MULTISPECIES: hypothetical protein [Enterococcus]ELB10019.1 hypothetical protein OIK_04248 [Enterococcus faecium EnGen0027]MBD9898335.1 hypothetical protein [Enterococcus faecium]MDK4371328.1 hypothetical protein [Enterococcus faecium]VFA56679.1 Uncharacterised protein [Enterococcus hirae]VTS68920.1 Uncharacterised protein [Enterococcus hirae]
MKVLKIDSGKSYFIVRENEIIPEDVSREDLLNILNDIYETKEKIIIPNDTDLEKIKNPVEKEIVQQIIQKISDFVGNIDNLREEIQAQFPEIED